MPQTVLITGANRGLGLALTKEYLARGATVLAGARTPEKASVLHELRARHCETLEIVPLDVADANSVAQAARLVAARSDRIDVLVNNAAYGGVKDGTLEELDIAATLGLFDINVMGPLRVTQAMLPLLQKADDAKVAMISSGLGAITPVQSCDSLAYGSSKAALNHLARSLAFDLKRYGILVTAINPGWMRTDMGGPKAPLLPEQSAAGIAKVIESLTPADSSQWFNWDGHRVEAW